MRKVAAVLSVLLVLSLGLAGSFVAVTGTVEASHAPTDTIVVNETGGSGTNDTIQGGVNHAEDGDVVFVESGVYEESVVVNTTNITIVTNESVTLDGSSPAVTGPAFNVTNAEGNVSNVGITGFTVTDYETGLSVFGTDAPAATGVDMRNITVLNNTIRNVSGDAVSVRHESGTFETLNIANNTIRNASDGVSVTVDGSASTENVSVVNNTLTDRISGSAVSLSVDGSSASLTDVLLQQNNGSTAATGLDVTLNDSASITDLEATTNDFSDTGENGIAVETGASATASIDGFDVNTSLLNGSAGAAFAIDSPTRTLDISGLNVTASDLGDSAAGLVIDVGGSSTLSDINVSTSPINATSGAAVALTTRGSADADDLTITGINGTANAGAVSIEALDGSSVSTVDISRNLLEASDGDAIALSAVGGSVSDVTIEENGLNRSTGAAIDVTAVQGGTVSSVAVSEVNATAGGDGLTVTSAGDDSSVDGIDVSDSLFNATDGTGVSIVTAGTSTVTDVSLETVDVRNNTNGLSVLAQDDSVISGVSTDGVGFESDNDAAVIRAGTTAAADATVENLSFVSTGFNESTGTGLTLSADGGEIRDLSLDTVTAGNNDVGIDATASASGLISGISTDVVLFGESDSDAGVFEATGGAVIEDLSFASTGFNQSGGTGLTLSAADGEIRNVSLDTVLAANNDAGLNATATGSGVIEDLTFTETGFNESTGTGLTLSADGGEIRDLSLDTVTAGNNDVGIDATASASGLISGISTDVVLFGESDSDAGVFEATGGAVIEDLSFASTGFNQSGGTGLTLSAAGGEVRNVSLDTVLAANNTVGVDATATGSGTIRNVSANTVLFSDNVEGLRISADGDALVEDVRVVRSGLNQSTNGVVFDGDGTYANVRIKESLIRGNDVGVVVTPETDAQGFRVFRSLIANNTFGIDNRNATTVIDARNNWWGNSSGPSSAPGGDTPYADPGNGKLAIGDGDSVSEGSVSGVSNVRFDPAIGGKTRNEEDGQIVDPLTFAETGAENVDQVPSEFSTNIAGVTIEGPVSDFVGLNLWDRSVLPLRADEADAANSIRNPEVIFRTADGDVSINRDFINVFQDGRSINVTFDQTAGADTTRFAGKEVQFHAFRANDTSSLSGAFSASLNETNGNVSIGSDDVEIVELRNLGEVDANGTVTVEFTPDRPGEYLFALTTVESGDGFELNDTGTGRLSANLLNDSTVFAGFELITVQQTNSTVTPGDDDVLPGEPIDFTAQSNLEGDNINHAVILYDKSAYEDRVIVLDEASVTFTGNETRINQTVGEGGFVENNVPLSVPRVRVNQSVPGENAVFNLTGFVDGEPFLVSINVTQNCDPANSSVPSSVSDAENNPCVNDITTSGSIEGVPFGVGAVASGGSTETLNIAAPTGISFSAENKTLQYVHAAVSGTNTTKRSTDVGTLTVQEPETNLVVSPESLDFGTRAVLSSTTRTVTVTNNGTAPVNLTSINVSGQNPAQFTLVNGSPTALAPGENTTIAVAFEPTSPGTKAAQLAIETNGSAPSTTLVPLNGTATAPRQPLEVITILNTSDEFRFLIRNLRAGIDVELLTPGLGDADVAVDSVTIRTGQSLSTPPEVEIRIEQMQTVPGSTPELTGARDILRYLNVTAIGIDDDDIDNIRFRFRVSESRLGDSDPENVVFYRFNNGSWDALNTTFVGEAGDGSRQFVGESPGFSAFAIAVREPVFEITDTSLNPERVPTGDTTNVNATIENNGTADGVYTAQVTANGEPVADQTVFVPAGESRDIKIPVSFDQPGEYDLAINGTEVGTLTVFGPQSIAVDPERIDFGQVETNTTTTESVIVTNEGGETLNISSVGIAGANESAFTIVNTPSDTLDPGENTTIEVEFTPEAAGNFSAQLDIESNDPEDDVVTVALSGSAEPPAEPPTEPGPPVPIIALVIILILAGILTAFYFRGDPAVMEFGGQ